jgi:predicted  nucleic acid-binding Zn-ribbon protein
VEESVSAAEAIEPFDEELSKLIAEQNELSRELRRVRERLGALCDRELELRKRLEARERTA